MDKDNLAETIMRAACAKHGIALDGLHPYQRARFKTASLDIIERNPVGPNDDYEGLYIAASIVLHSILRNE